MVEAYAAEDALCARLRGRVRRPRCEAEPWQPGAWV